MASVFIAITTELGNPFFIFQTGCILSFLIAVSGVMLTNEMETNEYAIALSDDDKIFM